ncbi:MAG: Clp protease N-terminal domain-containing protein [Tepidisphaerales bacterium]
MFEKFTDRARKVMVFARRQARRSSRDDIGAEHILLGLIEEGSGVAIHVLKDLNVDLRKLLKKLEKLIESVSDKVAATSLAAAPAKTVIKHATTEARGLNHNYLGTEHLLLGLLSIPDSVAARVLTELGVSLAQARQATRDLLCGAEPAGDAPSCSGLPEVVDAWPTLKPSARTAILTFVRDKQASGRDPTR